MEMVRGRFRLFPLLILVGCLALALRLNNLYSGSLTGFSSAAHALAAEDQEHSANAEGEQLQEKSAGSGEALDHQATETSPDNPASEHKKPDNKTTTKAVNDGGTGRKLLGLPSNEELALISQLRDRREQLDRREQQLKLQEQLLAGTEQRISEKITALQLLEEKIKGHLHVFEEQEAAQLQSIVQVYQSMKAEDAADRFQRLDLPVQVDLATRMTNRKFADILAKMDPALATVLTTELAIRSEPPSLADLNRDTKP